MHGVIFSELKRYADARLGDEAWRELLSEAELGPRIYMTVQTYPDEEAVAIITAAAARAGLSVPAVLEDFGVFIAPTLLSMYRSLIRPEWTTLDVLENTERTIHTVVRLRNPGAVPAVLEARRESPQQLTLVYSSPRQLCQLASGIIPWDRRALRRGDHHRTIAVRPRRRRTLRFLSADRRTRSRPASCRRPGQLAAAAAPRADWLAAQQPRRERRNRQPGRRVGRDLDQ